MALDWGKKDEFIKVMFRKSHSVHSRRFYEVALRKFEQFCEERKVSEISDKNVYAVLDGFVEWNDARSIRSKMIIDYLSGIKRFLLYQDIEIDENRFRNEVSIPLVTKIDEQPLTLGTIRRLLPFGLPNQKMLALILTLASWGMRLAEALNLRISDLDLEATPARVNLKAEYSKTKRNRVVFISDEAKEAIRDLLHDREPRAVEEGENRSHLARRKVPASPSRYVFSIPATYGVAEKLALKEGSIGIGVLKFA